MGGAVGLIVVILLAALALVVILGGSGSSDELYFAGSLTTNGPAGTGPGSEPSEAWSAEAACGGSVGAACGLFADSSHAYLAETSGGGDFGEGAEVAVRALRLGNGEVEWEADLDEEGSVLVGRRVESSVLVSVAGEGSGSTFALDPDTGDELWDADGVLSAALGGDLYLTTEEEVIVVEPDSGDEVWSADGQLSGVCGGTALVIDEGDLTARSTSDGEERWDESDADMASCAGDLVAVTEGDEVVALGLGDGEERWSADLDEEGNGVLTLGSVVVEIPVDDGDVVGRSGSGGEELWDLDGDELEALFTGDVALISGDRVTTAGEDEAVSVDLAEGEVTADASLASRASVIDDSRIYGLDDDEVVALDLDELDEVWSLGVDDEASQLAVGGGRLLVVVGDEVVGYS